MKQEMVAYNPKTLFSSYHLETGKWIKGKNINIMKDPFHKQNDLSLNRREII